MKPDRNRTEKDVCVLGSINLDIVASVERLPLPGETVVAQNLAQFPGGKGANQAVAAARMGARTLMIGAVGADEPGSRMRDTLQDGGVDISMIGIDPDHPTGQAFINVSEDGENAIVIVPGANAALPPSAVRAEELGGCGVFLAQLECPVEAIKSLFSSDIARRGITILNAAPALPQGAALFSLTDILILNESELGAYANLADPPKDMEAVVKTARQLIKQDGQTVIVTLGARGAAVINRARSDLIPGRQANVVDTTGAGDCFCGTLAAGLAHGLGLNEAARFATTAASISVERAGAATSIPTRTEVETALARISHQVMR